MTSKNVSNVKPENDVILQLYLSNFLNQIIQYNVCIKWQISSIKSQFGFHVFYWFWNILTHVKIFVQEQLENKQPLVPTTIQ
jgi:hypothetical protein